jgi:hypothetical protein
MDDQNPFFSANCCTLHQTLVQPGLDSSIPIYQRQYSWGNEQVNKMVMDICHGYGSTYSKRDVATFLGSIICVNAQKIRTQVQDANQYPAAVRSIIDGQQRMTSLLMLIVTLHERIFERFNQYKSMCSSDSGDGTEDAYVLQAVPKLLVNLQKCFIDDQEVGEDNYRYYPRMVRAYIDGWSSRKGKYESPIAEFIFKYWCDYLEKKKATSTVEAYDSTVPFKELEFAFSLENIGNNPALSSKYNFEHFKKVLVLLRNKITKFETYVLDCNFSGDEEICIPEIDKILSNEDARKQIYSDIFTDDVKKRLSQLSNKIKEKEELSPREALYHLVIQLMGLAGFVLHGVYLTSIIAKIESHAFDIFESLNTTGEPLTALETFKPTVLQNGESSPEDNDQYKQIESVESFVSTCNSKNKEEITKRLLVSFALAEMGEKLSLKLNEQRSFLKIYDRLSDEKPNFVENLLRTSEFYKDIWLAKNIQFDAQAYLKKDTEEQDNLGEEIQFCLLALIAIGHDVVHGVLLRYYSAFVAHKDKSTALEFIRAIKACTAFSFLWRAAFGGTAGIESVYRKLASEGCKDDKEEQILPPLCRLLQKDDGYISNSLPSTEQLKKAFIQHLKNKKIGDLEGWKTKAAEVPIYKFPKIARFLILAASHDSVKDQEHPGFLKPGRKGTNRTMTDEFWMSQDTNSIEHLAPENLNRPGDWNQECYNEIYEGINGRPELLHTLGNLTLLPIKQNSLISDRNWSDKIKIYKSLASNTQQEMDEILNDPKLKMSKRAKDAARSFGKKLELLSAIAETDENVLSTQYVKDRTNNLLDLAWGNIHPWLE